MEALLRDVMAGMGQDAETASTLPPAAYTSQAFFNLEMAKIFRREWIPVGHIAQVPSEGDYFTIDVLNELLMVVRGTDRIRVLSRTCLHRWAPVAAGAGNAKRFSCPFHLWAYDLKGQLVSAPLMNHAKDFEPKRHSLPEIRSEIVGGTIYISFSSTARSIGDVLADHTRALADYRPSDMQIAYSVQFDLPFNWKIAVETFMEAYHHLGAHADTLERSFPAALHWVDDSREGWTAGHGYLKKSLPTSTVLQSGLLPFAHLTEDQKRRSLAHLIYPMHCIYMNVDRIHWTSILPLAPDKSRWVRHVLVSPESKALPDFAEIVERLRTSGLNITAEDVAVNTLQQLGAASSYAQAGRLCHLEKPVWQLADYIRRRIAS
jgi:phenylpropionate dioxygenase-like ring-hydroxylating dioxygenase large terminal subunit